MASLIITPSWVYFFPTEGDSVSYNEVIWVGDLAEPLLHWLCRNATQVIFNSQCNDEMEMERSVAIDSDFNSFRSFRSFERTGGRTD